MSKRLVEEADYLKAYRLYKTGVKTVRDLSFMLKISEKRIHNKFREYDVAAAYVPGHLTLQDKATIRAEYADGMPATVLAIRFGKPLASIYAIVGNIRREAKKPPVAPKFRISHRIKRRLAIAAEAPPAPDLMPPGSTQDDYLRHIVAMIRALPPELETPPPPTEAPPEAPEPETLPSPRAPRRHAGIDLLLDALKPKEPQPIPDIPANFLDSRLLRILGRHGLTEWDDIASLREGDLQYIQGLGAASVAILRQCLAERGLAFTPDDPA